MEMEEHSKQTGVYRWAATVIACESSGMSVTRNETNYLSANLFDFLHEQRNTREGFVTCNQLHATLSYSTTNVQPLTCVMCETLGNVCLFQTRVFTIYLEVVISRNEMFHSLYSFYLT